MSANSDNQCGMGANAPRDSRLPMPRQARSIPDPSVQDQLSRISAHSRYQAKSYSRTTSPAERALISLLALNGLRVSEATGAGIEHLGLERGHRTLTVTRKGGKVVTIPLAPRTARAIDLAIGERAEGPVFLATNGRRLDRHGAGRIVRKVARRAGISKNVGPHTLRHAFITAVRRRRAAARRAGDRFPR